MELPKGKLTVGESSKRAKAYAHSKAWRKRNPAATRKIQADYYKTTKGATSKYRAYAKHKGVRFLLTDQEAGYVLESQCTYCGELPASGLGRLDPKKDYTPANTLPACATCLKLRGSLSHDLFAAHLNKIVSYKKG